MMGAFHPHAGVAGARCRSRRLRKEQEKASNSARIVPNSSFPDPCRHRPRHTPPLTVTGCVHESPGDACDPTLRWETRPPCLCLHGRPPRTCERHVLAGVHRRGEEVRVRPPPTFLDRMAKTWQLSSRTGPQRNKQPRASPWGAWSFGVSRRSHGWRFGRFTTAPSRVSVSRAGDRQTSTRMGASPAGSPYNTRHRRSPTGPNRLPCPCFLLFSKCRGPLLRAARLLHVPRAPVGYDVLGWKGRSRAQPAPAGGEGAVTVGSRHRRCPPPPPPAAIAATAAADVGCRPAGAVRSTRRGLQVWRGGRLRLVGVRKRRYRISHRGTGSCAGGSTMRRCRTSGGEAAGGVGAGRIPLLARHCRPTRHL